MVTKDELMKWLKTYKKEHCKSISTMKKDDLYTEAKKHGFLHEKHGLKKKNKTPTETKTDINSAFPKEKTQKVKDPVLVKATKKEIFQKLKELEKKDIIKMTGPEAKALLKQKQKLFADLKNAA
jgi:hypothetical protein